MENIANKMISALTLEERKPILDNFESNNNNIEIWKSIKSRLTDRQIDQVIAMRGFSNRKFNNAIQNMAQITDLEILGQLSSVVEKSKWFKVFEEVVDVTGRFPENNSRWEITLVLSNFVSWGVKQIRNTVAELSNICVDTHVYYEIEEYLYEGLFHISSKAFVYEFNKEKNIRIRYTIKDFVKENFSEAENVIKFYCKYPVLARRLSTKVYYMVNSLNKIFRNFDREFVRIKEFFALDSNKIISIKCGKGDTHRKGNTVCIIELGNVKIVYKPYRDELCQRYQEFLLAYNHYAEHMPMYISKNLYFDEFTLYEYIENQECEDKYHINRFYNRIGQFLAILHLLGANDMHCENMIACGEYPVIVDYETVIGNYNYKKKHPTVFDEFSKILSSSIANIGFFPIMIKGVHIGGLNDQGGTQYIEHDAIINRDDENIVFEKMKISLSSNKNVPIYDHTLQDYMNYKSDIISGFERAFYIILNHKKEFLKVMECFFDVKARVVLQATQNYADILEYSSHPKYLYDMLDMEKLFENILNPFHDVNEAFLYELKDFHNCDIPIFYVNSSDLGLITSDNHIIPDYFSATIYQDIKERITYIEKEYEFQKMVLLYYLDCEKVINKSFWEKGSLIENPKSFQNLLDFLNQQINSRLIVDESSETLTWLYMRDKTLSCALGDFYDGFGGLAWYLQESKDYKIQVENMERNLNIIKNMLLSKETYWENDAIALRRSIGAEIMILLKFYDKEKSMKIEEKISVLVNYIDKKLSSDNILSICETASMIENIYQVYEVMDDYIALQVMKKLGKGLVNKLHVEGYAGILDDKIFHAGNVMNALLILHRLFQEKNYVEEYKNMVNSFLSDGHWETGVYTVWGKSLGIKDGQLLRIGDKLFELYQKTGDEKLIGFVENIKERMWNIEFEDDTLFGGTCAAINFMINLKEEEMVKYYSYRLLERFEKYHNIRVASSPLYPELGWSSGYLGVAYTVLRLVYQQIEK